MLIERCPFCGAATIEVITDDTAHLSAVGNRPAHDVTGLLCTHCTTCDEKWIEPEQSEKNHPRFVEARRQAEHLLSSQEIEEILEKIPYSGREIGAVLGLGPTLISRWKTSKVCQSPTSDALLIAIGENPNVLEQIAQRRGIQLTGRKRGRQKKPNSAAQRSSAGPSYSREVDPPSEAQV